jgi:sensor histidine kinase YesM
LGQILFWVVLYAFFVLPTLSFRDEKVAFLASYAIKLGPQMLMAYGMLYLLIPQLLNKNKKLWFALGTILLLYAVFMVYTTIRFFYFEQVFAGYYRVPEKGYFWRIADLAYFASNVIWFLFPTVILTSIQYYRHQKEALMLREQKKSAELDALKNQLNPHFLFNTMNNLYALSLKKSDQAPEVIAKLSEMLDYMLYRCNDPYVSVASEVTLLNNYIALEKVRYGKRLEIDFAQDITQDVAIAPLLLLTFLENAFKHGVSQEVNKARIEMAIQATEEEIIFVINNTIASHKEEARREKRDSIGLKNVQKQLDLLYPNKHELTIEQTATNYEVRLKLKVK